MAQPKTTDVTCPFCSAVIFVLDRNGCIEVDLTDSSGCPHFAGSIDEDYCDGPEEGFEPLVRAYHLWRQVVEEGWTEAEVRAALAGRAEALALLDRFDFSLVATPQEWFRRIPGAQCFRHAWDGGGFPGHDGTANYVFVDRTCREQIVPALESFCEGLDTLFEE